MKTQHSNYGFFEHLKIKLLADFKNNHTNNVDLLRYPNGFKHSIQRKIKLVILSFMPRFLFRFLLHYKSFNTLFLSPVYKFKKSLDVLYNRLDDSESKNLMVDVLAFRILGPSKIKLQYNNDFYSKSLHEVAQLNSRGNLNFKSLKEFGYDLSVNYDSKWIYDTFVYKHYEFNDFVVNEGDVVLDLGAWQGDTALFFSSKTGLSGKVYSFEIIPDNITNFKLNIQKNKPNSDNIHLIQQPVWSAPNKTVYTYNNGFGSKVTFQRPPHSFIELKTISIDDFVAKNKIERIDFIKMDIEGAEKEALIGAKNTILLLKPKLAISIYHSMTDFATIHELIHEINPNHKFYMNHCAMNHEETILFVSFTDQRCDQ